MSGFVSDRINQFMNHYWIHPGSQLVSNRKKSRDAGHNAIDGQTKPGKLPLFPTHHSNQQSKNRYFRQANDGEGMININSAAGILPATAVTEPGILMLSP